MAVAPSDWPGGRGQERTGDPERLIRLGDRTGSVGLDSAEEVFRTLGRPLGTRAPRLPDGETGYARSVWIQSQAPFFLGNPAFEQVEPDPDRPGELRPAPKKLGGRGHRALGRAPGIYVFSS